MWRDLSDIFLGGNVMNLGEIWQNHCLFNLNSYYHEHHQGGLDTRTTPLWENFFKLTMKIRYTEKSFEIDRENPGFLRKRPAPFKILATPLIIN
jgi:hypothetical protein